jgi:2-polyprenyl-3-methyl-5-hydroxy-6-metoxy-1,4-benzoquinol methylase
VNLKLVSAVRRRLRAAENRRFVRESYLRLLGRDPDPATMNACLSMLDGGTGRSDVLFAIVRSEEYVARVADRVGEQPEADQETFLAAAYEYVLKRPPDPGGLRFYGRRLLDGAARRDVVRALTASDEHVNRVTAELYRLPRLQKRWPNRYVQGRTRNGLTTTLFHAPSAVWFDRLEAAILENDYYDKPGIWEFSLNQDKRLMAEIVAGLEPAAVLEIGCSTGTVLQSLRELGIDVTGVDISQSAIARAEPSIRDRIRLGDLLTIELGQTFDVVFGFDVFEHLNPNRLSQYLTKVASLTRPGGFVFTNLPAYGDDPVFGTVFPMELEEWNRDAASGRPFSLLPVDDHGYPFHGHLVWADSAWWVSQFEATGLRREHSVERALHECYDAYMRQSSPARRSFYVFSQQADPATVAGLAERIRSNGSRILSEEWKQTAPEEARV